MSTNTERTISVTVNGVPREATVPVRRLLSDALRHDLGLTGTHVGDAGLREQPQHAEDDVVPATEHPLVGRDGGRVVAHRRRHVAEPDRALGDPSRRPDGQHVLQQGAVAALPRPRIEHAGEGEHLSTHRQTSLSIGGPPAPVRSSVEDTGRLRGRSAPRSLALAAMLAPCRLRASPCDARSPVGVTALTGPPAG